jgi:uncharacterized glyoxalase superfamily protein PhnB
MARPAVNPIPEGFRSITPHLVCKDAMKAIEFYKAAFGAEETSKLLAPDGKVLHAALRIGDSIVMLTDECPPMGAFGPEEIRENLAEVFRTQANCPQAA